jgi:hypothetical protein
MATELQNIEAKVGFFLSAHHIILYVLLTVAVLTGVYLIESKVAALETARANAAQQALEAEKDHSAQLVALVAQRDQQRERENTAFLLTISQIQAKAQTQIAIDKTLPVKDAGHRIESLTGFKQGTVTFDATDNLIVPLPLGREIVVRLDQGAADAQTVVQQAGIIKNQAGTIADKTAIIVEAGKVLVAQIDTDTKVLNAEKAKGRKGKLKWFGIGVVVGYLGRVVTHP